MPTSNALAATDLTNLSTLGNVPAEYRHEWRVVTPRDPILVPGGIFKWYHVHREGAEIPAELDAAARTMLTEAAGPWDMSYGLNIAQLHLSTAHAFLIAGVWRGHQELWQRAYWLELAAGGPFARPDMTGEDAPFACVWELGVICHERMAWHRYLFSARDEAAKQAWLADTRAGAV